MQIDEKDWPTDFKSWGRANLESYAVASTAEVSRLRSDLQTALTGWRKAVAGLPLTNTPSSPATSTRLADKAVAVLLGVALTAVVYTNDAQAQPVSYTAVAHTASWHTCPTHACLGDYTLNQRNPGVGLRAQLTDMWSVQGGAYRNSYRANSGYALLQYAPMRASGASAGVFVGLATGYANYTPVTLGPLALLSGVYATVPLTQRVGVTLRAVPKTVAGTVGVVALEIDYKL